LLLLSRFWLQAALAPRTPERIAVIGKLHPP
jgi:hypothetical protein